MLSLSCYGQHSFSPPYRPPVHDATRYPGYGMRPSATAFEAASIKQSYTVVYLDSTTVTVRAEIGDHKGHTFLMINEPGIAKAIKPKDTRSLIVGTLDKQKYTAGIPADSCWLFKITSAPINLYSLLPKSDSRFVVAVQKGDDAPILALTEENALALIEEGHPARKWIAQGKLIAAVKAYNGTPVPTPAKGKGSR